jgi:hypothetical protein
MLGQSMEWEDQCFLDNDTGTAVNPADVVITTPNGPLTVNKTEQ